jgi:hypothetical protein
MAVLAVTFDAQPAGRSTMFPRKIRRGTISLGTYATNGIAVTPKNLELIRIDDIDIQPSAGYVFEYLPATGKVKAYRQKDPAAAGGADIPLPEVANAVDISAVTARFRAEGA